MHKQIQTFPIESIVERKDRYPNVVDNMFGNKKIKMAQNVVPQLVVVWV